MRNEKHYDYGSIVIKESGENDIYVRDYFNSFELLLSKDLVKDFLNGLKFLKPMVASYDCPVISTHSDLHASRTADKICVKYFDKLRSNGTFNGNYIETKRVGKVTSALKDYCGIKRMRYKLDDDMVDYLSLKQVLGFIKNKKI